MKRKRTDLGPCGREELRWALAVYSSRALSVLWTDGKTTGSLVPLADVLNHWGGGEIFFFSVCLIIAIIGWNEIEDHFFGLIIFSSAKVEYLTHPEQGVFSIRAQYNASAGQQLFLNYGCRTEEKMLINYGFTEVFCPIHFLIPF